MTTFSTDSPNRDTKSHTRTNRIDIVKNGMAVERVYLFILAQWACIIHHAVSVETDSTVQLGLSVERCVPSISEGVVIEQC